MTGASRDFVYEASSQIERLSDGFVQLQREGFDRGTLDDLFREAHTLKGNCSAEGFAEPAETAHALEDLLDGLRTRPDAFEESSVDVALEALDVLERQLMDLQTTGRVETDADGVVASIRDLVPEATEASDASEAAGDESVVAFDDLEVPAVESGEDVSVEEALDNAAVFDDLEELEGSVDASGFEDVEGVGLFDADDGTVDASGVESSTRRDSDVVPGEESYAEMVSDTPLADPDDLQSELEDVSFGEFDDEDDLSIDELVDLADESSTGEATTVDLTDEAASVGDESVDESASSTGSPETAETEFEFGQTEGVEAETGSPGEPTERDASPGTSTADGAADAVVEPLDLDAGVDAEATGSDPGPSDEPAVTESDDEAEGGATERTDGTEVGEPGGADGATADGSVVDIVSRIERLEGGVSEPASGEETPADDVPGDEGSTNVAGTGDATADDQVNDVLDVATGAAASPDDPEVLPSEVPDVDRILEDTEFEDVEDVEFATAEFYDRVGFETDSSTGAFVSEFGEAFGDDTTNFETDAGRVAFDASSTIDPELLDADAAVDEDQVTSVETVREVTLDVEAADTLLELAEELVVDTQRLAGALEELPPEAADALASLRDVSTRIEDHVSNVRLVPLDAAFSGLPRTSRRVARAQDKEVAFLTENGDVEVDRRVVDELADPLVHLVRNAIDHGIEPPDERVANGKPREGTVLVRAERSGETVTVAVEDDGRGADPDELRAAAVDAGLYTRAEANALSRAEALELMFHAGLSTTDEVSEVSGRGVGMDVVSDVVTRLEGTLDVRSEPGVGTTVELTLPVSVALSDVLTVAVGSQRFGLPAADVRRVEEFVPGRVDGDEYRLLTDDDDVERVPIVDLATALDVDDEPRPEPARTDVLVLTADPDPRALRCRDVVDWESVVLQPFDGVLADHALARGAALTGDGSPVVVLEPPELGVDQ